MKKIAFFMLTFCLASIILYLFIGLTNPKEMIYIHYLQSPSFPIAENEATQIIKEINIKNSKIKNFFCSNVEISIDNIPFKLQALLIYEKKLNFRMLVRSFVGKELDIGSNKNYFWFWSKRMVPSGLYYAKHKDLYKTKLRTPFSPKWIMESLGFEEINNKVRVSKSGLYLIIEEDRISSMNTRVTKKTLVNIESRMIVGHYLYENNRLISSAEVKESRNNMPYSIRVIWHEENIGISLKLNDPGINNKINSSHWIMPDYRNKINMIID
jgi:hypothetical protein